MKLTKEQLEEIKNQQSQSNQTKRVTSPELEKILYELPALDHGFVKWLIIWVMYINSSIAKYRMEKVQNKFLRIKD